MMFAGSFAVLAALSGYLQACSLRRLACGRGSVFGMWWRLGLVTSVLVTAAVWGQLLGAAVGWGVSFLTSVVFMAVKLR